LRNALEELAVMTAEPVVRVGVVVTFLRMDGAPATPPPALPDGAEVRLEEACDVPLYRELYDTVGAEYVWWLRRTMPDRQLAALLRHPAISIHVLYHRGRIAGFYELDRSNTPLVNLSYFGLMPHAVGHHLGFAFLRHAVDTAWEGNTRALTVNTCTADHPRALPTYLRAGFRTIRQVREDWDVPERLGLVIPDRLRI
jgi:GNAT superfamily N-acetyltransferase